MGEAKRKKQRDCPATGGVITPEDCGRGRNSSIACPTDCPHNPFNPANYLDQLSPLEGKVLGQLSRKLAAEVTPSQLREITEPIESRDAFSANAIQVWYIHGSGRLDQWIAADFHKDWKNDERVLLKCLTTLRPSLLEFRGPLDKVSSTAVDLLEPGEPFRLIEASAAVGSPRYDQGLTWTYDVPGGRRLNGGMTRPPNVGDLEPTEMLRRLLDHLGAPPGWPHAWMLEHMSLLEEAFREIGVAVRQAQIGASDLRRFTLRFPLPAGQAEAAAAVLAAHPRAFQETPDATGPIFAASLLADGVNREVDETADVIGELRIYPEGLMITAYSARRADAVRELIASLGLPLGPEETSIDDAAASLNANPHNPDLVPPEFLANPSPLDLPTTIQLRESSALQTSALEQIFRDYPDKPIPLLDGRTPREAAADPVLRPKLARLLKDAIRFSDGERMTKGIDFDFNTVLREIGMDELIAPAPPVGFVEDEEDDEDDIPLDPPPRQTALTADEVRDRLNALTVDQELWNRLEIRLADVLDAFNDLPEKLNDNELSILQSTALMALGALHATQPVGYDPYPDRMLARHAAWISSGDDRETFDAYLDRIFAETRQPALCEIASDMIFGLEEQGGRKLRPKKVETLLTALAAAIWEAAHWPPST